VPRTVGFDLRCAISMPPATPAAAAAVAIAGPLALEAKLPTVLPVLEAASATDRSTSRALP
jgi:hypothetical protein